MNNELIWVQNQRGLIYDLGLVAALRENGRDPFASDKRNARIRAQHGDTPYCAPDVDPETGKCPGGDAWPACCEGHQWLNHLDLVEDSAKDDGGGCQWHILVRNTDREIDFPSDLYDEVRCGAKVTSKVAPSGTKGWECENGHDGWEYGSAEQQSEELEHEFNERRAEGYA